RVAPASSRCHSALFPMGAANLAVVMVWAVLAVSVVLRLSRRGAATFDDRLEPADRQLVGMTAFYLCGPALVLVSQLVTLALSRAFGAETGRVETWILWGSVEVAPGSLDAATRAWLAAAGPLATLTFAGVLVAWTRLFPSRAAHNHLRLETARVLLLAAFAVQPLASLLAERGDLWA